MDGSIASVVNLWQSCVNLLLSRSTLHKIPNREDSYWHLNGDWSRWQGCCPAEFSSNPPEPANLGILSQSRPKKLELVGPSGAGLDTPDIYINNSNVKHHCSNTCCSVTILAGITCMNCSIWWIKTSSEKQVFLKCPQTPANYDLTLIP